MAVRGLIGMGIRVFAEKPKGLENILRTNKYLGMTAVSALKAQSAVMGLSTAVSAVASVAAAGLAVGLGKVVSEAIEMERIMTDLRRITRMHVSDINSLSKAYLEMSATLPMSAAELGNTAVELARLGVRGMDALKQGALTAAKLSKTTVMSEAESAIAIGRISKVFGMDLTKNADKVASAMVKVATTTTATADILAKTTMRMGGMARQMGFTAPEVIGLAGVIRDLGEQPTVAATQMIKFMTMMSKRQKAFADFIGVTQEVYSTMLQTRPMEILVRVLTRLGNLSRSEVAPAIEVLGLNAARAIRVFMGLTARVRDIEKQVGVANNAFRQGTELNEQYAITATSVHAKIMILIGSIKNLAIIVGSALLPPLRAVINVFIAFFAALLMIPRPIWMLVGLTAGLVTVITIVMAGLSALLTLFMLSRVLLIKWASAVNRGSWAAAMMANKMGILTLAKKLLVRTTEKMGTVYAAFTKQLRMTWKVWVMQGKAVTELGNLLKWAGAKMLAFGKVAWSAASKGVKYLWGQLIILKANIMSVVWWQSIWNKVLKQWGKVTAFVTKYIGKLGTFTQNWIAQGRIGSAVLSKLSQVFGFAGAAIASVVGVVFALIASIKILNSILDVVSGNSTDFQKAIAVIFFPITAAVAAIKLVIRAVKQVISWTQSLMRVLGKGGVLAAIGALALAFWILITPLLYHILSTQALIAKYWGLFTATVMNTVASKAWWAAQWNNVLLIWNKYIPGLVAGEAATIAFGKAQLFAAGVAIKKMIIALWGATAAVLKFTWALLTNPVTWIVLGIAAAVAFLGYVFYKAWGLIKVVLEPFFDLMRTIGLAVQKLVHMFRSLVSILAQVFKAVAIVAGVFLGALFFPIVAAVYIIRILIKLLNLLIMGIINVLIDMMTPFVDLWNDLVDFVSPAVDKFNEWIDAAKDFLKPTKGLIKAFEVLAKPIVALIAAVAILKFNLIGLAAKAIAAAISGLIALVPMVWSAVVATWNFATAMWASGLAPIILLIAGILFIVGAAIWYAGKFLLWFGKILFGWIVAGFKWLLGLFEKLSWALKKVAFLFFPFLAPLYLAYKVFKWIYDLLFGNSLFPELIEGVKIVTDLFKVFLKVLTSIFGIFGLIGKIISSIFGGGGDMSANMSMNIVAGNIVAPISGLGDSSAVASIGIDNDMSVGRGGGGGAAAAAAAASGGGASTMPTVVIPVVLNLDGRKIYETVLQYSGEDLLRRHTEGDRKPPGVGSWK